MSRGGRATMFYSPSVDRVSTLEKSSRVVWTRISVLSEKHRLRPMARYIVVITGRKSRLIDPNGRCKGCPRIIVNVAVVCNKINYSHCNIFILYLKKL